MWICYVLASDNMMQWILITLLQSVGITLLQSVGRCAIFMFISTAYIGCSCCDSGLFKYSIIQWRIQCCVTSLFVWNILFYMSQYAKFAKYKLKKRIWILSASVNLKVNAIYTINTYAISNPTHLWVGPFMYINIVECSKTS